MTGLSSFRIIETDRLILRAMSALDAAELFKMRSVEDPGYCNERVYHMDIYSLHKTASE